MRDHQKKLIIYVIILAVATVMWPRLSVFADEDFTYANGIWTAGRRNWNEDFEMPGLHRSRNRISLKRSVSILRETVQPLPLSRSAL